MRYIKTRYSTRAISIVVLAGCLASCTTTLDQLTYFNSIVVSEPDLSRIADGSYAGSYRVKPAEWKLVAQQSVEVRVEVRNHRYHDITITAPAAIRGMKSLATLRSEILSGQSLATLDAVSASTMDLGYTGKAYLKAVEKAVSR